MLKIKFFCLESVSFNGSQIMQDIPMQPEKMFVETTPYCLHVQLFRMQSVWQTHLTVFSSSGGDTCLVISIGIIPRLVSCQPQFEESSTFSPLYSCIWWYIKSIWSRSKSFNINGISSLTWNFLMILIYPKLIKNVLHFAT